jgi:hypothetical protein
MPERDHSPESPQAQFSRIEMALARAADRFWKREAAEDLPDGGFTYNYSAAGFDQAVILPDLSDEAESLRLVISIGGPTARMREALGRLLSDAPDEDTLIFAINQPQHGEEADVECIVKRAPRDEDPVFMGTLDYASFIELMEAGGICERVGPHRRMGRWALRKAEELIRVQADLAELEKPLPSIEDAIRKT